MRISVIIPTVNEAENILSCLISVCNQPGEIEVIVVDGDSSDATVEKAQRLALVIRSERGRAVQMNAGARRASGEVLLFLHADSILHPSALIHVRDSLKDAAVVGGTFMLRFDVDHPILRFYAFFTRFKLSYFHYGDQGIFVRRAAFEKLVGFKEVALMEDLDFLRRLRRLGRVALVKLPVITSARRFIERGPIRQQLLNCVLVALYSVGVSPETLARWYLAKDGQNRRHRQSPRMQRPGDQN
jgi:rSAM/selenodomain-associated transferase 2